MSEFIEDHVTTEAAGEGSAWDMACQEATGMDTSPCK